MYSTEEMYEDKRESYIISDSKFDGIKYFK